MLRKDVKYMVEKDWEPTVPSENVIRTQSSRYSGRLSGSVRLAVGRVTTGTNRSKPTSGRKLCVK